MTQEIVLSKARTCGFITKLSGENYWQILPTQAQETWKLTEFDSRWILSVKNIPQLYLDTEEALSFLVSRDKFQNC